MAVDAWWRNEAGQALEELEWCEAKFLATVHVGLGEPVHQASLRRRERLDAAGGVESLEGERPPRTVASEPLQARAVLALDADGAVDRKAAGAPPRAHVCRRGGVQEPAPCEPPQDAQLHRAGQGEPFDEMRDVAVLHPGDSDLLLEDIVAVAVAKLPSAQREVAELRLCGWRLVDIATGTQRTVGTVKRLWYRARRVLRTALGPYLER
jgi:hypothetical protein